MQTATSLYVTIGSDKFKHLNKSIVQLFGKN